jgi:2-methylisocitrate lyase-like PEP mutase family enzyme
MADAQTLRELHAPGSPLVLPNAWDADTARLVAEAGFPAVATSSGAVAAALGYADHQAAPGEEMLAAAARIAAAVPVPVTVDAEAGYGIPPAELAQRLIDMGVAGCNIEDTDHAEGSQQDPREHAQWLHRFAEAAGGNLVINARVDSFYHGVSEPERTLTDAVERAELYLETGADCVYPILITDPDVMARFVAAVAPAPVNILHLPDRLEFDVISAAKAARISMGIGLWMRQREWLRGELAALGAR